MRAAGSRCIMASAAGPLRAGWRTAGRSGDRPRGVDFSASYAILGGYVDIYDIYALRGLLPPLFGQHFVGNER